ncbi:Uncharacterised protein [Aeromonas salmonicida]|uniref:hypothetical protein n=1 Tax=Aeromonas salmonicida TaxID=645 RepID=UPI001025A879|nr:hypothetical protein [Aeromonas salmonicida]VFB10088.1 Uncharacterised protein [Aeromonas salmonicida]
MSIDIDNLTGTESLEELEAALNTLEDGSGTTLQPQDEAATQPEEKDVSTAPSAAEEEGSNTTDEAGQTGGSDERPEKVILSKDGKHHIPYDVLEAERAQRQALAAENAQLKAVAAEREKLQQVLDKHGIDPDADPDALNIEEIEQLSQDYPEIGKVLTGIAKRLEMLKQPKNEPTPPQAESTIPDAVQTALQAVPELATWMEKDQDRATFAVSVDERLKADPAWKDKPLTERFAEVAKRTKAAFGDQVEQQAPPAEKPVSQKKVEERDHIPVSPSDLGQSVQHESKADKYGAMSQEQLIAEMATMTPAQIEALLEEQGL